ncbi:substrate-binding domain-containing protein [Sorangium sp. So ce269]
MGTPAADAAVMRKTGFAEAIAKHPDMKIIASQSGDVRRTKGKAVMETLLSAHKGEINAVYAHNDDMALGAIQATLAGMFFACGAAFLVSTQPIGIDHMVYLPTP